MKEKTFYQVTDLDCGLQALKTMYYYYSKGKEMSYREDLNHEPYSFYDLKEIASKEGLELNGYEVDDIGKLKPCIVQLKYKTFNHFMFFIKAKKDKIILIDPNLGKLILKKDEFLNNFTGCALCYENINIDTSKKEKKDYQFLKDLLLESIISIPLFVFIFDAIFKKQISLFWIIIIIFSFIIKKIIVIFRMRKFDVKLENIFSKFKNEKYIVSLYKYKEAKFNLVPLIFNYFLTNFSYFFIVLNLKFGYVLAFIHLLYLIVNLRYTNFTKTHIFNMEVIEKETFDLKEKYQKINKFTNKFVFNREIINICFLLVVIIALIILNNLYYHSSGLILSLTLFYFYLTNKVDFYNTMKLYKDYQKGKTILKAKEKDE